MPNDAEKNWRVALIGLGALVAVAAIVAAVLALGGDDDDVETVSSSTTAVTVTPTSDATTTSVAPSSSAPTTTTAPSTTAASSTTTAPGGGTAVVWPRPGSGVRYADPVDAARAFAEELVGFTDPVVGQFRAGDSRSGEVPVQARGNGPVTTVLVRRSADDSWSVLGSQTDDIQLTQPAAGTVISDPVTLVGRARAFEGTVDVRLMADGEEEPIGEGFVTGSGGPDLGPFEGSIDFADPGAGTGVLMLTTVGGEDSVIWQATVIPVSFGS